MQWITEDLQCYIYVSEVTTMGPQTGCVGNCNGKIGTIELHKNCSYRAVEGSGLT